MMRLQVQTLKILPSLLFCLFFYSAAWGQSVLNTSVTALDFGPVTVGKTGAHKLTLINSGGGSDISVTALNIGGANAGDFGVLAPALPFTIPNGDTLNIIVTTDPGSPHTKNGSLTVVNNGAGGNPLVTLTSEGCEIQANPAPDPAAPTLEQGGKLVVEIESANPPAGQEWTWSEVVEDTVVFSDGDTSFTPTTYYKANLNYTVEGGGGVFGTLCYKVQITNPGFYRFKLLSRQGETVRDTTKIDSAFYPEYDPPHPPAPNHENDIWMKVTNPAATVYAVKGNTPYVDSTVTVDTGANREWFKVFQGDFGWTDNTTTIDEVGLPIFIHFAEVDTYTVKFSVRSKNFCIDKFTLYNINMTFVDIEDPAVPVSPPAIPCPDGFWWYDNDGDGYGDAAFKFSAASQPIGFANNPDDCDDAEPNANPGLTEVLDNIDNNCNTFIDEGFAEAVGPCQIQRFNAGYESTVPYVAASGFEYAPDNTILISNSAKNTVPGLPIANTTEDELYRTARTGTLSKPIHYQIPVTNGGYDVLLHFAEIYQGVSSDTAFAGQVVFDVIIEGDTVLDNFDIYAAADSQATATVQLVSATVNDGLMNIVLAAVNNGPSISAIELYPQAGCGETTTFPVEFVSFKGAWKGDVIGLEWKTASEVNNDYFEIERSNNGLQFTPIGKVASQGNSQSLKQYSFTDANPLHGTNYYRLKQVDFDGAFGYSAIVEVLPGGQSFDFFPNPVKKGEQLTIYMQLEPGTTASIQLMNSLGQILIEQSVAASAGNDYYHLDMQGLSQGYYLLSVENEYGKRVKKLVVIE